MDKNYIICLGGGLLQEPLIAEAHSLDLNVIVTDINPNCHCRELSDKFWEIDIFDSSEHVRHCQTMAAQESNKKILGLVAAGIDAIETAWKVNNWIKLQTKGKHGFWAGYKATQICRNKYTFREHLKTKGFNIPRNIKIVEDRPVIYQGHRNDYIPFIIKPVDNSGGRGNRKFSGYNSYSDYSNAIIYARSQSKLKTVIAEELLKGTEHTVETIWEDGKMYRAFITDRYFKNDDNYAIEAGASHPSTLSTGTQGEIYSVMESLGNSLGMKHGPLKGDVMLVKEKCPECHKGIAFDREVNISGIPLKCPNCADGRVETIYILEATTRYSGGFDCQYLVPLATGKNILKAAIESNVYGKFDKKLLLSKFDYHTRIGSPFPKEGIMKG